jgi:hypothetical protein
MLKRFGLGLVISGVLFGGVALGQIQNRNDPAYKLANRYQPIRVQNKPHWAPPPQFRKSIDGRSWEPDPHWNFRMKMYEHYNRTGR